MRHRSRLWFVAHGETGFIPWDCLLFFAGAAIIGPMKIVDAHLDLSYNAIRGRDVTRAAKDQIADKEGIPTVGLPDLRAGNVDLICATIFCAPEAADGPGYKTPEEASAMARAQWDWYRQREQCGDLQFVRSRDAIGNAKQQAILLMEGADPIVSTDDVSWWFEQGLRIVGLAWRQTRYAGGTGAPGPITAPGVHLVNALDRVGIIHDASHLAEQSFRQLLEISSGPVIATHSNCRAIVPTDRQLSDEMILAIAARGGVIGINFFDKFLIPPEEYGKRRAKLSDVVRHISHICDLLGDARHVALGTDMDGGLGRDEIPQEITTSADLHRVGDALYAAGFNDQDVNGILADNWSGYFREHLAG